MYRLCVDGHFWKKRLRRAYPKYNSEILCYWAIILKGTREIYNITLITSFLICGYWACVEQNYIQTQNVEYIDLCSGAVDSSALKIYTNIIERVNKV